MITVPTPPLWIVQTNLGNASDIRTLVDAVAAEGLPCREAFVIPFSGEVPDIAHDGPVVCYGSTGFTVAAHAARRWTPGVWLDDAAFTYGAWVEHLGDLLLNGPAHAERTTIAAFLASPRPDDEVVFVRPERDLKQFSGEVTTVGKHKDWCRRLLTQYAVGDIEQVRPDTPITVGTPFTLAEEWRLFVVDGRVCAASQYAYGGEPARAPGAPPEVITFGEAVAARWSPASVYTLDVCRSGEGLYVVESQGFNSAGMYAADRRAIVRAVSAHAAREWAEQAVRHGA